MGDEALIHIRKEVFVGHFKTN